MGEAVDKYKELDIKLLERSNELEERNNCHYIEISDMEKKTARLVESKPC